MLTIKHQTQGGRERVFTATSIDRTPEGLSFGNDELITTGKIYVMNDAGKTVAVYDFDKEFHNKT